LRRYTSIPQKSDRQKQIDRLSALLKIACLQRDQYQCGMCGKLETPHPQGDRIFDFRLLALHGGLPVEDALILIR
jgi:hypothetical protein